MVLNRKQLDKLFQITAHFHEINKFDVEVNDEQTITVSFSLLEDNDDNTTTTADIPARRSRVLK